MVRDGYYYGIAFGLVALMLRLLRFGWGWTAIPLLLALFFLWFFRDPERVIPQGPGLVVSPADGVVTEIARLETPAGARLRISIFLSVFDVHINRSPIGGVVTGLRYQKGRFGNALSAASAEQNEQNVAVIEGEGAEVTVKQIAGLLARRIVFTPLVGQRLQRGERIGMIKFGSRVDVLLPESARVLVARRDRVRGGASILAELSHEEEERELVGTATETFA